MILYGEAESFHTPVGITVKYRFTQSQLPLHGEMPRQTNSNDRRPDSAGVCWHPCLSARFADR